MTDRERAVQGMATAHRTLESRLAGLTDEQCRRPSLLPDWTVGHVLTHIARNADGMRAMVEGADRGEVAPMYPGGMEQRNADIARGAARTAAALIDDVRISAARLELAVGALDEQGWAGRGVAVMGEVAVEDIPHRRRREVEVHHLDLGLGYTWEDWPADYVRDELRALTMIWDSRRPMGMTGLPPELLGLDERLRVAWLLGRATIEGLGPAGVMG